MWRAATASYQKTLIASSAAAVVVFAATFAGQKSTSGLLPAPITFVLIALGLIVGLLLSIVALGSLLVMYRNATRDRGAPDLFLAANGVRSEGELLVQTSRFKKVSFSKYRRWLGAPDFIVGDAVRIRPLSEIALTLNARGCLDGLPFMPEMAKYCGTAGTVFRCVDKVYDYGGKKDLRRLKNTVLIAGLRCDGSAHGDCQAGCYMLWKTAWIARADALAAPAAGKTDGCDITQSDGAENFLARTFDEEIGASDGRYMCQYTQLVNASTKMSRWDPRQDLRPFIAGNVTTTAFGVAIVTRFFNAVQRLHGGLAYPPQQAGSGTDLRHADLGLQPGETVRVASPDKIFATLNRIGKNRGLWFDQDMLKHCGRCYQILRRVDRIIDDASGRMLWVKTPCVILKAVDNSGEHLRFSAQHDLPFWRETWLERVEDGSRPVSTSSDKSSESTTISDEWRMARTESRSQL